MEQLVLRYALPGLPLALTLYVAERLPWESYRPMLGVAVLIAVAVLLGTVIQQIWMLIFEYSHLACDSPRRPVLRSIHTKIGQGPLPKARLYAEWESFLYSTSQWSVLAGRRLGSREGDAATPTRSREGHRMHT